MALYMVLHSHTPEECEPMEAGVAEIGPELKGKDFYCTCPSGEHAFYMFLEGETSEQVLAYFPPSLKLGKIRVIPVETWRL